MSWFSEEKRARALRLEDLAEDGCETMFRLRLFMRPTSGLTVFRHERLFGRPQHPCSRPLEPLRIIRLHAKITALRRERIGTLAGFSAEAPRGSPGLRPPSTWSTACAVPKGRTSASMLSRSRLRHVSANHKFIQ